MSDAKKQMKAYAHCNKICVMQQNDTVKFITLITFYKTGITEIAYHCIFQNWDNENQLSSKLENGNK